MTPEQHQQLVMIMFDLESFAHSWIGEVFTTDHRDKLIGTADTLDALVKSIREDN